MHWDTAALASSGSQRSHLELALCDEGHHRSDIPPVRLQTKARRTRDATRSAPLPTDHAKPCTQRDFSLPLHYSTHLAGSTPHRPRTAVHTARLLTALALQHPPRRLHSPQTTHSRAHSETSHCPCTTAPTSPPSLGLHAPQRHPTIRRSFSRARFKGMRGIAPFGFALPLAKPTAAHGTHRHSANDAPPVASHEGGSRG
jgi:hypothetical protein